MKIATARERGGCIDVKFVATKSLQGFSCSIVKRDISRKKQQGTPRIMFFGSKHWRTGHEEKQNEQHHDVAPHREACAKFQ
jgi:hypothetical protein